MGDEVRKSELARQDAARQQAVEKEKPKSKESEFAELLKSGQMSKAPLPEQGRVRPVAERAIHEAAKEQERHEQTRKKEEKEREEKQHSREGSERGDAKVAEQKVVGKGAMKEQGQGSGGGRQGGFGGTLGRRSLMKSLSKAGAKSIPISLQGKFAAKMAASMKAASASQPAMAQQVLNKIVQYVRIGINRAGEKEIQLELHEKIFRGLKLRVIARGGKVGVHFRTADARGREIFEQNRDAIRDALEKKGISVDEITIA